MRYLSDIAHAVAHPELKNQGPLRDYVADTDVQMAKALRKMRSHRLIEVDPITNDIHLALPPAIKPLSIYAVVMAFFISLEDLFPRGLDIARLASQTADIELCIYSILHHTQLPYLDGSDCPRHGYLAIQTWRGRYHLYAGVTSSKYEDVLLERSGKRRDRPFINVFPVFEGLATRQSQKIFDVRQPNILFTRRDEGNHLYLSDWKSPFE